MPSAPAPALWLPAPADRPLYAALLTDHYPWSEVYADLSARPGLSAALEVRGLDTPDRQARFVWADGELLGGHDARGELGLREVGPRYPRAQVSLLALDPACARLLWACRNAEAQPLTLPWPQAQAPLEAQNFRGALLSAGGACSLWDAGRPLGGGLPQAGETLRAAALREGHSAAELAAFWQAVFARSGGALRLSERYAALATELSDEHLCLDPFSREVWLAQGGLHIHPELPLGELQPALLALYRALLEESGQTTGALPLGDLPQHPLWGASGIN